jgi:hypothetical protein
LRKTAQSNPLSNGYATLAEKQMQIPNRNTVCPGNRGGRQIRFIESLFNECPNALEQARSGIPVQRFLVPCQRRPEQIKRDLHGRIAGFIIACEYVIGESSKTGTK